MDAQCAQETNATCCAATHTFQLDSALLEHREVQVSEVRQILDMLVPLLASSVLEHTTRPPATRPISTRYESGVDVFLLTMCEVAWFKPLSRADA